MCRVCTGCVGVDRVQDGVDRVEDYAQSLLTIGYIWEVTRVLSNLSLLYLLRSGVTLRRGLLLPTHLRSKEASMRLILPYYSRL